MIGTAIKHLVGRYDTQHNGTQYCYAECRGALG
jgi:hypothetical protein